MSAKFSFQQRLLLGQILPALLLFPLIGLALIYLLETQVIVPSLANEMIDQGFLVVRLTKDHPEIWTSTTDSQSLLDSTNFQRPTRISLLDTNHVLIATSRPDDHLLVGKIIENIPANNVLTQPWWSVMQGDSASEPILAVIVPVQQADGRLIGLVRVYRRMTDIHQSIGEMCLLILGIALISALLAGGTAYLLLKSIAQPLKIFSRTIADTPLEGPVNLLPENPADEFIDLTHSYNQLQKRRMELEKTRQQMLANLIHEIGRPLGSLRTALHALQAGALDDPALRSELLNGMAERIDRMGRLLEDLALIYRKLEPYEIHKKPVVLQVWIQLLIPLWTENARQKGIEWETSLPSETVTLSTDPDRLAQVLSNLISNAIKFTSRGGKISLIVTVENDTIQFQVKDTGIGIPLEDLQHLFIPFYRGIQPPWKTPGVGLGLSIAKSITESLGGNIAAQSIYNQGSIFTVRLPLQAQ